MTRLVFVDITFFPQGMCDPQKQCCNFGHPCCDFLVLLSSHGHVLLLHCTLVYTQSAIKKFLFSYYHLCVPCMCDLLHVCIISVGGSGLLKYHFPHGLCDHQGCPNRLHFFAHMLYELLQVIFFTKQQVFIVLFHGPTYRACGGSIFNLMDTFPNSIPFIYQFHKGRSLVSVLGHSFSMRVPVNQLESVLRPSVFFSQVLLEYSVIMVMHYALHQVIVHHPAMVQYRDRAVWYYPVMRGIVFCLAYLPCYVINCGIELPCYCDYVFMASYPEPFPQYAALPKMFYSCFIYLILWSNVVYCRPPVGPIKMRHHFFVVNVCFKVCLFILYSICPCIASLLITIAIQRALQDSGRSEDTTPRL